MTVQGIILLDIIGIAFIFWIISLVRHTRLYVGYGVIFITSIFATMMIISVPFLLHLITRLMGALFPASALTMLALGFIIFLLIYILTQTTILSNRLSRLVQEIAIRDAEQQKKNLNKNTNAFE
ncbi:DUF2304 domain-containing protein [candidate division KSB1 bacterium]|nr:DUF2304 domain-containing protein [candidate division KSB1 bacterium]